MQFATSFVENGNNTSQISTSQIESQRMCILLEEIDAFWSANRVFLKTSHFN